MPAIGITGGISTGKTTFIKELRALLPQARFFDADEAARALTREDPGVLAEIRAQFGDEVFDKNGELNRAAVRAIIFAAPAQRRALENILHPRIRQYWSGEAATHRGSSEIFCADIPLLYETGGEKLCDRVAVVACSGEVQLTRLMKRTGLGATEANAIIAAQMPLAEKMRRADFVVWNNGPAALLAGQAKMLVGLWTAK